MTQIATSKSVAYVSLGPTNTAIACSKVVGYVILVPDGSSAVENNRQGHVYTNITRRLRS